MDMLLFFRTIWRTSCRTLRRRSAASLIALLLVGWSSAANAFWALGMVPGVYIPQSYYKHGAVYTRAIVLSQAGNPYYVEYDSSGNEGREIAEKTGQYERAQIVAGTYYRSQLQRLADSKERYPEHEELTAAAYRSSSFTTAAGETIQKPSISPAALTVLVRAQNNRYLKDGSDLLLLELPIKASVQPSASSQSILLSEAGDILHQTANTIAFRVGFFGKDGKVETSKRRDFDSQIYGKMPNVVVSMGGFTPGGIAATDENGKYSMNYFLPPCPGFTFEYTTPVYLELYYSRFNPRGNSMMPYYLVRQDYDFCNGLSALSMWATLAMTTSATFIKPKFDFPVDLMVVDGAASFANVKLDAKTAYNPDTSDYAKTLQNAYDFDGDEKPEIIVPGKKVKKEIDGKEREVFVETAVAEAELQGIYLSSRHSAKPASTEDTAPDFTRLIDTTADFKDRGMLQSITSEDLRDTDIYVFRESTGQLVAERRGLHENELYKNYSGVDDKQGSFRFTIQLRGSAENTYALSGRNGEANFNKWQSAGGFTEEFQKRTANHLKSGEQVRIIAINRPTGYMGSARINLNASLNGNLIDLNQARIQLTPPNLKIWAERKNKIEQGMTRGEEKKQLIGNEGAGLGSDISIAIYSDWRDQDGGPLPEALADYGYTGRLAKIVAANQLAPVGANNLSQFKIKPGQQVQVIQLPEKVLAKQHLYLQVAGQPENRNPDFATGNGQGILKYRPSKYVPVQVPLHDEQASEIARQAYRKADKEKPELNLKKPEPMYSWQYRPEMQFSLYELNIKEVRKIDAKNLVDEVYQDKKPVLASSDKLLELFYDLLRSEFSELEAWSYKGNKELVLAVGEQEILVEIGKDKSIRFENLQHLKDLDVDDYLSLRMYANNDSGNVLLEWAFEYLSVLANEDEDFRDGNEYYYISADNPTLELKSILAGYNSRREAIKKTETVNWSVQGAGSVSPATVSSSDTGIFTTLLSMPASAGSEVQVSAKLLGGDASAYFKKIIVVPGQPAAISATLSGALVAGGLGEIFADVYVTDKNGNPVVSGTAVDFSIDGQGKLSTDGAALVSGRARVRISDAKLPGADNYFIARVEGVEQRVSFGVSAVTVTPEELGEVYENRIEELKVTLAGVDSKKVDLSGFSVKVSRGSIIDSVARLDDEGKLVYRWHTGYIPGEAEVYYSDGSGWSNSQKYNVLKDPTSKIVDKRPLVLLSADSTGAEYVRVGGQRISLPISKQANVQLNGAPGEVLTVRVGTNSAPNRVPIIKLRPGELERSKFLSNGSVLAKSPGFRYQQGKYDDRPVAYNYKGYEITLTNPEMLYQAAASGGISAQLDFAVEDVGLIFSWRDVLVVERGIGKYLIKWKTTADTYDIEEIPDASAGLDELLVQINGADFSVAIGGQSVTKVVPQEVLDSALAGIQILGARSAELHSFSVALLNETPLLAVNETTTEVVDVQLDSQGHGEFTIKALGNPQQGYQTVPVTVGAELLTVAIYTPQAIGEALAGLLELSEPSSDELTRVLALDVRDTSSFAVQANLAASLEANTLLSNAEKIGALLRVLASLPEGEALVPHVDALERFSRDQSTPVFQHELVNVLARTIAARRYADSSNSYKLALGLLVFAEMLPAYSDVANYIVRSISAREDLDLWLATMAMPANGWAFFSPPTPQLEQSCTENVLYAQVNGVDTAPYNPCRLRGDNLALWVTSVTEEAMEYRIDPSNFMVFLRGVHVALPEMSYGMRSALFQMAPNQLVTGYFDPTEFFVPKAQAILPLIAVAAIRQVARIAMQVGKKLGKNFVGNFIAFSLGKSNTRMHPFIFLLSTGYVYENLCEEATCIQAPEASDKFWALMRQLMVSMAFEVGKYQVEDTLKDNGGYQCRLLSFAHGNMYEMFSIAYYHLQSRVAGGKKIVNIDRVRKVPLYGKLGDINQEWIRRPDIELEGGSPTKTTWIELKSVQASQSYKTDRSELPNKDEFLKRFPIMSGRVGGSSKQYHKQFVLDRIAAYGKVNGIPLEISKGYHWRFQHWKEGYVEVRTKGGGKKRLSRGYPMKTAAVGASGTYLDMLKEQFAKSPQRADMYPVFGLEGEMSSGQLKTVFENPLFDNMVGDADEYLLNEVVKQFLKEPSQIEDIKEAIKKANSVYEVYEEWAEYLSVAERLLGMDFENEMVEDLVNKGRALAEEYAERNGYCKEDD